jgi:Rrf2 family protein
MVSRNEVNMRISTRSRYGIRAMTSLAAAPEPEGKCARAIADEEQLSRKYLESILARLRAAGFVRSVRGAQGGYVLARPATQITVDEIVRTFEGSLALVECADEADYCAQAGDCVTRQLWVEAEVALTEVFKRFTIATLVAQRQEGQGRCDAPPRDGCA